MRQEVDKDTHRAILAHASVTKYGSWSPPPPEFLAWLRHNQIPPYVEELLAIGMPTEGADFHFWNFVSCSEIMEEHERDGALLAHRLLYVGACLNGDPIVIDLAGSHAGHVAQVSHERYWGSQPPLPREWMRHVACNWTAFLIAAAKDAIPIDSSGVWSESNSTGAWIYRDLFEES